MSRRIQDLNIVIVEDDPHIRETLDLFFNERNTVRLFASAEEALVAEKALRDINVFILDYKLPGKNGIELFQHFRSSFPKAKFVLITGEMNYDMAESTLTLGLDALILKPFDFKILEDNISGLVASST